MWEEIVLMIEKNFCKCKAEGGEGGKFANVLRSLQQFVWTVKCQRFTKTKMPIGTNNWNVEISISCITTHICYQVF